MKTSAVLFLETAMGQDVKAQENSDSDYVKAVYEWEALTSTS